MTNIEIKVAGIFDVSGITDLMETYWHQAKEEGQPLAMTAFDKELCHSRIGSAVMSDDSHLVIAKEEDKVVGVFWFVIITPIHTDEYYAGDYYFYVLPEYQNGKTTFMLFNVVKHLCKQMGCAFLQVGNLADRPSLDKMYSKRGTKLGTSYILKL